MAGDEGKVGPGREGLMALASAGCDCEMSSSWAVGWPSSCQGCGLQNWRLWRLRRLCSVMAGGTARPAAAEGEAGHEPGTGWPGPQVAALRARRARAWQAEQAERKVRPSQTQICGHLWWRQTGLLSRE